jgi:hypothetical protein
MEGGEVGGQVVVDQRAIGLEAVGHHGAGAAVFFLEIANLAEEIEAHEGGSPPCQPNAYWGWSVAM